MAVDPTAAAAYRILGVPPGSRLSEVKAAYRRLALQCHPDVNEKDGEEFRKLTAAYQRILNSPASNPRTAAAAVAAGNSRASWQPPPGYRFESPSANTQSSRINVFNKGVPQLYGVGVGVCFVAFGCFLVWSQTHFYVNVDPHKRQRISALIKHDENEV